MTDNERYTWDTPESIRDFYYWHEDALYQYVAEQYEIDITGKPCDVPYWYEQYYCQDIEYKVQYIPGYWENKKYGDIIEIDNVKYKYIDSISLDEEIAMYTDDNEEVMVYCGAHFLRVLEPINKEEEN